MHKDLIQRLRDGAAPPADPDLNDEAADALEAMQATPTRQENPTDELPVLGRPPIGLLTSGEVALLRAWAEDYARAAVAAERAAKGQT